MTAGAKRESTPAEIAQFGHIAMMLRKFLIDRDWGPADLNQALGNERTAPSVYNWLNARGAPAPDYRAKLAQLVGVPEEDLMRRELVEARALPAPAPAPAPRSAPVTSHPTRDILTFTVNSVGETRIKLDVSLPRDKGTAILRMLLDAGLVLGSGNNWHDVELDEEV